MKKFFGLTALLGMFFVTGCTDDVNEHPSESTTTTVPTVVETTPTEITSDMASELFVIEVSTGNTFVEGTYIEVNYAQARQTTTDFGRDLVFTFNQSVTHFTFYTTDVTGENEHSATGILKEVGNVDSQLVLRDYFIPRMDPLSGFSFEDAEGVSHWYVFVHQIGDTSVHWEPFDWHHDREFFIREEPPQLPHLFTMDKMSSEDINSLGIFTEVNWSERETDLNVVLTFRTVISDLAFIYITLNESGETVNLGTAHPVEHVRLGEPIVLRNFYHIGTIANSGFTFTDSFGKTYWYGFEQSQMDGSIVFWPFHWHEDYPIPVWEFDYHEVLAGETLFSISRMHDLTVEGLQAINELGDSTNIYAGQMLRLGTGRFVYSE